MAWVVQRAAPDSRLASKVVLLIMIACVLARKNANVPDPDKLQIKGDCL